MKVDRKWLWIGGALAAHAGALALGVPLGTLLIVAAILACPAMMFFGMRAMHQGAGGMASHPGPRETRRGEASLPASSSEPSSIEEPARRG